MFFGTHAEASDGTAAAAAAAAVEVAVAAAAAAAAAAAQQQQLLVAGPATGEAKTYVRVQVYFFLILRRMDKNKA